MLIDELEKNETAIILDTNALLKIYNYQPEMMDFAIKCLYKVEEYIVLPSIVCSEFENHHYEKYGSLKKKYKTMKTNCITPFNRFVNSLTRVLENEKNEKQFNEIDSLKNEINSHCTVIEELINDFVDKYDNDNSVELSSNNEDLINRFYEGILSNNRVLRGFSQSDLYKICLEGEKRYRKKIPPGFADAKKGGIRQFSDLILWKEIIQYSKNNSKNVLLVCNDVKGDWREQTTKELLPDLIKEFECETNKLIKCYSNIEFFEQISEKFNITKSEHIVHMICKTNESYCSRIANKVYESIQDKIEDSIINNNDSMTIGSEGLENIHIDEYTYEGYSEINYFDDEIEYTLIFSIKARATSRDYWGGDEDDILYPPDKEHFFEGTIEIVVYRYKSEIEDISDDSNFQGPFISGAYFEEVKYISEFDAKGSLEYARHRYQNEISSL